MKSTDEIKASAVHLRNLLDALGIQLKHSESLEVISKLEGFPDWNTHTAYISKQQQMAEQYLSDMLEGHSELNYTKITKYLDKECLKDVTEKEFLREHSDLKEDLGPYVSREYLGSIDGGPFTEPQERYPEAIRHVWRGVFEQHEVFIHMGIYTENGARRVGEVGFK
jgi:hypothetical protein